MVHSLQAVEDFVKDPDSATTGGAFNREQGSGAIILHAGETVSFFLTEAMDVNDWGSLNEEVKFGIYGAFTSIIKQKEGYFLTIRASQSVVAFFSVITEKDKLHVRFNTDL